MGSPVKDDGLADAGYFSEANLGAPMVAGLDAYVPPDRLKHRAAGAGPQPPPRMQSEVAVHMRAKLATPAGRAIYALRKTIVEPVFGQIKEIRGFPALLVPRLPPRGRRVAPDLSHAQPAQAVWRPVRHAAGVMC
jgi:hypothetical protein